MAPFGSWFIMLAWAASFGDIIHYFELKNSMLEEYVITIQVWLFVCIGPALLRGLICTDSFA